MTDPASKSLSPGSDAAIAAYIGRKPGCGCVVAAIVDDPAYRKQTSKDLADFVKRGYGVERVSVETAQVSVARCQHTEVSV